MALGISVRFGKFRYMRPRSNAPTTPRRPRIVDRVQRKHRSVPALLSAAFVIGWGACTPESGAETDAVLDVVEATIGDVQAAIHDGTTTCREVVERHLARIAAYEDAINAITVLNPRALDRAATGSTRRWPPARRRDRSSASRCSSRTTSTRTTWSRPGGPSRSRTTFPRTTPSWCGRSARRTGS